ncbi:MAG: LamG domain-containing protein [Planctomycetota bacterium]
MTTAANTPTPDDQFSADCLRYLDGEMSEKEFADFQSKLETDPALQQRFVELNLLSECIAEASGSEHAEEALVMADLVTRTQVIRSVTSKDLSKVGRREALLLVSHLACQTARTHALAIGSIAAVLVIGVVLLFTLTPNNTPAPSANSTSGPSEPGRAGPVPNNVVATLTAEFDAAWDQASIEGALIPGSPLRAGQRFSLAQGFAEITTVRGAKVLLQAPCSFELIDSDNAIRLNDGKLVGTCETPSSKGFTVFAPGVEVIDLGTVFGVEARKDGTSTIMVMDGSVLAKPSGLLPEAFEPVVIHRDQARRVLAETGALETIAVDDSPVFHTEPIHPYVATVREAKPLVWLRMNELSPDSLLGSARFRQVSEGYQAVEIDGKGCIDAGDVMDFEADQTMSFAGWVRLKEAQDDAFVLGRIARNEERGLHGYDLYLKEQRLYFQLTHRFEAAGKPDAHLRVAASEPLMSGRWYHVAVTYDGSRRAAGVRLYVDGQPVQMNVRDDALGENSIRAETTFRLGIRGFAQPQLGVDLDALDTAKTARIGSPLVGGIGDFVVFDRALFSEEVSEIHSHSESGYSER